MYEKAGEAFHDVLSWHLLHGLVLVMPAFLWLGYFCQRGDLSLPMPRELSDTIFITFMTGDMRAALESRPLGIDFLAFERIFKNSRFAKVYPIDKFQKITT